MIIILCDSREQASSYIIKFLMAQGIDAEVVCFPQNTGCDYLISNIFGSCAIQRKVVVPEMIGELDEIMFDILPRLQNFSDNPVLCLEENFSITKEGYLYNRNDSRESQLLATSYYGYLETIRKSGIDVITTRDLNCSLWWMVAMHGYLAKQHYPKHRKYFSTEEQAVGMLTAVPGIGPARALKALQQHSIREMGKLRVIDGLTEKQSERVLDVLRRKP